VLPADAGPIDAGPTDAGPTDAVPAALARHLHTALGAWPLRPRDDVAPQEQPRMGRHCAPGRRTADAARGSAVRAA